MVSGTGKENCSTGSAGLWQNDTSSTGKTTERLLGDRLCFLLPVFSFGSFFQFEPRLVGILVPLLLDVLVLSDPQSKEGRVFVFPPTSATICGKDSGKSDVSHANSFSL